MTIINFNLKGDGGSRKILLRNKEDRCNLQFRSTANAEIPPQYIHMFQLQRDQEIAQCGMDPHCARSDSHRGEFNMTQCVIVNMTDQEIGDAIFSETHLGDSTHVFKSKTRFLTRFGLLESVSIAPFGTVTVNGVELYDGRPVILITGDLDAGEFVHTEREFDDLFTRMAWRVFGDDVSSDADTIRDELRSTIEMLKAEKTSIVSELKQLRTEVQELRSFYVELVRLAVEDSKRLCAAPIGNPFDDVAPVPEFEKTTGSLLSLF